ncbi:MAG: LamG domain-containing protein [Labilithrix sp.]|nr:LamG domain-containing protein [Labilithrix sp.]MCW5810117.1 LamG domain-containing protein [Labilithrix sp.]
MRRWLALGLVALAFAACRAEPTNDSGIRRNPPIAADDDDDQTTPLFDAGAPDAADTGPAQPEPSKACLTGDLAFCFTFEGTTDDVSPNAIKPTTSTNITFAPGKENQAASFTATSALRFDPNPVFELSTNATIEAWIRRQNTGADSVVLDVDGRFSLTIDAAANVLCKSGGGAVTGNTVVAPEVWAHVACVVDNGTLRVYLNGTEIGSGPGAIGSAPTLGAAIGGNSPDGEPFLGLIDSLRVFTVARTPAQISEAAKP